MPNHVYKLIELTGSSTTTIEDAVQNAIAKAAKTMRNMHWFQVATCAPVAGGKVVHWQVTIKAGFTARRRGSAPGAADPAALDPPAYLRRIGYWRARADAGDARRCTSRTRPRFR
jgi:flavin-binding protein dodecin